MEAVIESDLDESVEESPFAVAVDDALGGLVDGLAALERSMNRIAAFRVEQVYGLSRFAELNTEVTTSHGMRPWSRSATARRTTISEVSLALRIPERSAETLIEESRMLVERLPLTMAGLSAGNFSYRHAKSIVAHAQTLSPELHAAFEAAVVPSAANLTFSKFDQKARKMRERMDAATITERHQRSLADRETSFEPALDGMGWLHLYTSAHIALGAYNRADDMARELNQSDGETRTLTQLRADVISDLLLDGAVGNRPEFGIRPSVVVTVPVLAMLGVTRKNGESDLPILEGYGPIDIETATKIAGAGSSWLRVLTHPETGAALSVGRDRYKVPAALRSFLQRRDGTCRKPGCNRPAVRCDIDHTEQWQHGGQTAHDNLAHLCQMHHDEKHHTKVTLRHLPNGDLEWTMPSGRTYLSEPENRFPSVHDFDPRELGPHELGPHEFGTHEFGTDAA